MVIQIINIGTRYSTLIPPFSASYFYYPHCRPFFHILFMFLSVILFIICTVNIIVTSYDFLTPLKERLIIILLQVPHMLFFPPFQWFLLLNVILLLLMPPPVRSHWIFLILVFWLPLFPLIAQI